MRIKEFKSLIKNTTLIVDRFSMKEIIDILELSNKYLKYLMLYDSSASMRSLLDLNKCINNDISNFELDVNDIKIFFESLECEYIDNKRNNIDIKTLLEFSLPYIREERLNEILN